MGQATPLRAFVASAALLASAASFAEETEPPSVSAALAPAARGFGVGVELGAPSALTAKLMSDVDSAWVAGLGVLAPWHLAPTVSGFLDYLWHPAALLSDDELTLSWFWGGGAWFAFAPLEIFGVEEFRMLGLPYAESFGVSAAARVPLGVSLAFHETPVELYGQVSPSLLLYPAVGLGLGASGGARFFF